MSNELLLAAFLAWLAAALIALTGRAAPLARALLLLGCIAGICAAIIALPAGTALAALPTMLAGAPVSFQIDARRAWLLGFGLAPAALACALATPARSGRRGLAVRRRNEPDRSTRRVRRSRRRGLSDRLGDHELRRRRDDLERTAFGRCRPAGSVHARSSGSRRGRAAGRCSAARRGRPIRFAFDTFVTAARDTAVPMLVCHRRLAGHRVSAPSLACCRSTSGSRPLTAPAAAHPAR